jgi:hypothetical protein
MALIEHCYWALHLIIINSSAIARLSSGMPIGYKPEKPA